MIIEQESGVHPALVISKSCSAETHLLSQLMKFMLMKPDTLSLAWHDTADTITLPHTPNPSRVKQKRQPCEAEH